MSSLREEVVQANQLRKQQLVELGLLREEEKQKLQREHETMVRPTAYDTVPMKRGIHARPRKSHPRMNC